MNAVEFEIEMMDPSTYWFMHKCGWHVSADMAAEAHCPAISDFYRDLEDAAGYICDLFGLR